MAAKISERIIVAAGCFLVFMIPVSIAGTNIAASLCIVAFLAYMISRGKVNIEKRYAFLVLLFMVVSVASVFNSLYTTASVRGIQRLMKCSFIFFALCHAFGDQKRMVLVSWAFLFGLLLVSVDGLFQFNVGWDFLRHSAIEIGHPLEGFGGQFKRINASFHNSQDLAAYLAGAVPFALCVARYGPGNAIRKTFYYLVLVVSGLCLIFTYSRGAAVGMLSAVVICALIKRDRLIALVLVLLLLSAPFFLADAPLEWAAHRDSPLAFFYDSSRLMHWRTALNMIKAHPFVGIGTNAFCPSYQAFRGLGDHYVGWYAHNSWLQLAAETGILGAAFIVLLVILIVRNGAGSFGKSEDDYLSAVTLGLTLGLISYCLAAFWDSSLQYSNPAVFFWTLLGLTAAAAQCCLKSSSEVMQS